MNWHRIVRVGMAVLFVCVMFPTFVHASNYTMTIDCDPQTVDVNSFCTVTITIFDSEKKPLVGENVFIGAEDISGKFENQMLTTNSEGVAQTKFYPAEIGEGYILAKANIRHGSSVAIISAETIIFVQDLNKIPIATITEISQKKVKVGEFIQLKGVGKDIDGEVIEWKWNMGDGTIFSGKGAKSTITHMFDKNGEKKVLFKVRDNSNAWSQEAWVTINVFENHKPTIEIDGKWKDFGLAGQEMNFPVIIRDIDQNLSGCTFDWGDGESDEFKFQGGQAQINASHTYKNTGNYFIRVIASDLADEKTIFPGKEGWNINIEGQAKGSFKILINGFSGEMIDFIGPFPSRVVAYTGTLNSRGIEVKNALIPGRYKILSTDKTKALNPISGDLEIFPFKTTTVKCKAWIPYIKSLIMVEGENDPYFYAEIFDSNGAVSKPATVKLLKGNKLIGVMSSNNGKFNFPLDVSDCDVNLEFNIDGVIGSETIHIPDALPKLRLITRPLADDSIQLEIQCNNMGLINLETRVFNRLTSNQIKTEQIISTPPTKIKPGFFKMNINKFDSYKYIVCMKATCSEGNIVVTDNISFTPYIGYQKINLDWGYFGDKITITGSLTNRFENTKIRNQCFIISAKPDNSSVPQIIKSLTPESGSFLTTLDINELLKKFNTDSLELTVLTISSGITFTKSFTIRKFDKQPSLIIKKKNGGLSLQLLSSSGEVIPGKWITVKYLKDGIPINDNSEMDKLGEPVCSVRTSQNGNAVINISETRVKGLSLLFHVSIDGFQILKEFKF